MDEISDNEGNESIPQPSSAVAEAIVSHDNAQTPRAGAVRAAKAKTRGPRKAQVQNPYFSR